MRQISLLIIACLLAHFSIGQTQGVWVRFYNATTDKSGYKDLTGKIKIPARFEGGMTRADTFHNIIAVMEMVDNSYKSYYLLKGGREVGHDSVFMFDYTFDCESEGKIIFRDRKKDRVGFLDKNGVAKIPALYNYVSPFRNNLAIAHRNAKRKCWDDGGDTTKCEHLGWEGGETILINDNNDILVDSLIFDLNSINWYSKKVNDPSVDTSIYVNLKGRDNNTYSFVDYYKEFKQWFGNTFLPTLSSENETLKNLLFTEVTYLSAEKGWTSLKKNEFLKLFPKALTSDRFQSSKLKKLSINEETTSVFMTESKLFSKYYDACREHNRYRFPAFDVMLTYYKKRLKPASDIDSGIYKDHYLNYQEHFVFLRTEDGYKLLNVSSHK